MGMLFSCVRTVQRQDNVTRDVQDNITCAHKLNTKDEPTKDNQENPRDYRVQDLLPDDIDYNEEENNVDYSKSLINLPTELLVMILLYLPMRDRIMIRCVSRRFRDVSEFPSLWKDFLWPDYEPRHVCSVSNALKACGENVRRIYFPAHVTSIEILEMARCCTKVTHLRLPTHSQLTLDHLKEILCIMIHLQQLDVFTDGNFIQQASDKCKDKLKYNKYIEGLLTVTAISCSLKELKLQVHYNLKSVLTSINFAIRHHPLPSIISVFTKHDFRIPMNLYPPLALRQYKCGSSVRPLLIKFGMVDLKRVAFCVIAYDHFGTIKHTVVPLKCDSFVNKKYFLCINRLYSVTYIDISCLNFCSDHLEQLAVACPNLQRLNLKENVNCLKDLKGLDAIVHTCHNLEGINLIGISVLRVESHLLLWELLSSLKKLTHLAIDLCMLKSCDDDNKQKLIDMFKNCQNLQALEMCRDYIKGCEECTNTTDFLFSYFPSLIHCRMYCFRYSALTYVITNCHKLKYLYEKDARKESLLPLSNKCHLQQLCIYSLSLDLTDELVKILSAHGELECVVLYVKSMTVSGITTLINNSPKLIILHISLMKSLFNEAYSFHSDQKYMYLNEENKKLSYRKLFTIGSFNIRVIASKLIQGMLGDDLLHTDLKSLWPPLDSYKTTFCEGHCCT